MNLASKHIKVRKTIVNHSAVITIFIIFIGGMVTMPSHGWFMALFYPPYSRNHSRVAGLTGRPPRRCHVVQLCPGGPCGSDLPGWPMRCVMLCVCMPFLWPIPTSFLMTSLHLEVCPWSIFMVFHNSHLLPIGWWCSIFVAKKKRISLYASPVGWVCQSGADMLQKRRGYRFPCSSAIGCEGLVQPQKGQCEARLN